MVVSLILFFWIDSTIGVAYELDFFHRDTLRWRRFRKLTWAVLIVGAIGGGAAINAFQYILFGIVIALPVSYASITLAMSVARVHDETMRRYIRWVGLIVVAVVLEIVTDSFNPYLNFPLVPFAYFLYRAAASLSIRSKFEK